MDPITEANEAIRRATRYIEYVRKFNPELHNSAERWANGDGNFADHLSDPYAGKFNPSTRKDNYRGD